MNGDGDRSLGDLIETKLMKLVPGRHGNTTSMHGVQAEVRVFPLLTASPFSLLHSVKRIP